MPQRPPARPVRAARLRTADVALAAALGAVGLVEASVVLDTGGPAPLALPALLALPLVARRRAPAPALLVVAAGFAAQLAEPLRILDRTVTCYAVLLLAAFSLGRAGDPLRERTAAAAAGGAAAAVGVAVGGTDRSLLSGALAAALVLAAVGAGRAVAVRAELRRILEEQARVLAAAAGAAEEAAEVAERERLAGTVRDVVHRQVERMLGDVRTARGLLADPGSAGPVIAGVEAAGREALAELRTLLGILRGGDDPPFPPVGPADAGPAAADRPVRRPRSSPDLPALGVVVVAAVEAAWSAAASGAGRAAGVAACLGAAAIAAPLMVRRSAPLSASAASWAVACLVVARFPLPAVALTLTAPVLAHAAGAHARPARSWVGLALGWTGVAAVNLVAGDAQAGDYAVPAVLVGLAWLAGRAAGQQAELAAQVAARNAELARLRDAQAAGAAARERLRIARELHDVVAHTVMVMVVQAGAARRTLADPGRSRAALDVVAETGAEALGELRRLLALASSPAARDMSGTAERSMAQTGTAPTGMAALSGLVARARATGLAVELRVAGPLDALPGAVDLAAYRVVQEALTNTLRHAAATRVVVDVRAGEREVRVEVRDDGQGAGQPVRDGNGISGMRERVHLHGGEFTAGPTAAGFVVSASFPTGAVPHRELV